MRVFCSLPPCHKLFKEPWVEVRPGVFERRRGPLVSYRRECQDCRDPKKPDVILVDSLWKSLGVEGILCADCVEKRIGRRLTIDDLKDCGWKREILYWRDRLWLQK